jgi:hypothetical protein
MGSDGEHSVPTPVVFRKSLPDGLLGRRRDRVQDFALAGQRSAEDDEPVIYERVHKVRVLVPAGLFPQIA